MDSFVKIWRMRNEGTVAWPENTRLAYVGGDKVSPVEAVTVPSVKPGEEVDIAVDVVAPARPGRYVSYWRLCLPDGNRFGHRVWVDMFVNAPNAAASAAEEPKRDVPVEVAVTPVVQPAVEPVKEKEATPVPVPATEVVMVDSSPKQPHSPVPVPTPVPVSPPVAVPVTAPVVTPVAPPVQAPAPLSQHMQLLVDMGFENLELNARLLEKNGNDVLKTVQDLLSA